MNQIQREYQSLDYAKLETDTLAHLRALYPEDRSTHVSPAGYAGLVDELGKPGEPGRARGQGRAARRMIRRAQRREAGSFTELCRSAPVDVKLRRLQRACRENLFKLWR